PLDIELVEGHTVSVGALNGTVYDVSGHTINHVAFCFNGAMFTGDSLMALGCGRVFEGSMAMMWESLSKLASQPAETMVYSGHEYTQANGRFAITIEPDNADLQARIADIADKRSKGIATVPSLLALELATNPFLRAGTAARFAEIRTAKDRF
ncbi:MAG: hydroxyacylglutathione hydrolase, partial [Rhodobacteraceae bacterium]|nr:hydroxyacylglutathione hydrolase [Paracoccaceae bacterium]